MVTSVVIFVSSGSMFIDSCRGRHVLGGVRLAVAPLSTAFYDWCLLAPVLV